MKRSSKAGYRELSPLDKRNCYLSIFHLFENRCKKNQVYPPNIDQTVLDNLAAVLRHPWTFFENDEDQYIGLRKKEIWKKIRQDIERVLTGLNDGIEGQTFGRGRKVKFLIESVNCGRKAEVLRLLTDRAFPKCALDELKEAFLDIAQELQDGVKANRPLIKRISKQIDVLGTCMAELQESPVLYEFLRKPRDHWEPSEHIARFKQGMERSAALIPSLQAAVSDYHRDFLTDFFAFHADQVLRNERLLEKFVEEKQRPRKLRVAEVQYIIAELETVLFSSSVGYDLERGSSAVEQQIRRWEESVKGRFDSTDDEAIRESGLIGTS